MKLVYLLVNIILLTAGCRANAPVNGWDYQYGVGSPGKKSETVYGKLLYNEKELPNEYGHVITIIGEFVFVDGRGLGSNEKINWVPFGKLPGYSNGTMSPAYSKSYVEYLFNSRNGDFRRAQNTETLSSVSTEPCLDGTFEKRPQGVGANWFFVVKQNLWVNPQKIDEVLKTKLTKPAGKQ